MFYILVVSRFYYKGHYINHCLVLFFRLRKSGFIRLRIVSLSYRQKLCNQRQFLSHDVELNNKGILHLHLHLNMNYVSTNFVTLPLSVRLTNVQKR